MSGTPALPRRLRWVLGLPRHLYAHGMGPLLGHRFLLLTHTGRRTGRRHGTVLEVVRHRPVLAEHVVVSGFGTRADWLRNIEAGGPTEVTVGRRTFPVEHRVLGLDEATAVLADYERRNRLIAPVLRRVLSLLVGWRYHGTEDERRAVARLLPLVALRPAGLS